MKKITLVAATHLEIAQIKAAVSKQEFKNLEIEYLIHGVGGIITSYYLTKYLSKNRPDIVIQLGIAGAFKTSHLEIGDTVQVVSEKMADLGATTAENDFLDVFDLNLMDDNDFPFQEKKLNNTNPVIPHIPTVAGLTLNSASGHEPSIQKLIQKFNVEIESMEGAAFFYCLSQEGIPFYEIRSISNYVESRNKKNWNIPLALANLKTSLCKILLAFDNY